MATYQVFSSATPPASGNFYNYYQNLNSAGTANAKFAGNQSTVNAGSTIYMFSSSTSGLVPGVSTVYLSTNPSFSIDAPSGAYYTATYQGETTTTAGQTAGLPALSNVTAQGGATAPAQSNMVLGNNQTPANYAFNGTVQAFCLLTGTHVTMPTGEVLVEDLSIGDIISTADGSPKKVFWIGKKTHASAFLPEEHLPVLITAGALGNGLPKRDLQVMPAHAFLIGDVLVVAGQLVNGSTIRRMTRAELGETFTYYAIETEDHCLILAEGAAAETKGNIKGDAGAFDNWSEYVALYGEEGRSYPNMSYPRYRMVDQLPREIWQRVHGYEAPEKQIRKTA